MSENQKITKDIVILYHAECPDGFGGAWAAWKKFGDEADYIPLEHQMPLPEELKNKDIFLIDIVPAAAEVKKLISENKKVVAIDHHKTSEPKMALFKDQSFDMGHSGAVLAWKYFHPDKEMPKMLLLIEDIDIWKWEYPETEYFSAALSLYDYDFETWDGIFSDAESPERIKEHLSKGEIISTYLKKVANDSVKHAQKVEFDGYKVYSLNGGGYASNLLREKFPPFSITWIQEGDMIHVSLRSDGSVDVSEIAQRYGGGGQKAAAGFSFQAGKEFPWKIIKD